MSNQSYLTAPTAARLSSRMAAGLSEPGSEVYQEPQATMINRDISLVEFYRRVLEEMLDRDQPLLERVKFLSIFSSLVDEFFMVRIAGLKAKAGSIMEVSPDGLTAAAQLQSV